MPLQVRAVVAEAVGTGILAATVIGSGIMATRTLGDNVGLALLVNSLATAAILAVLVSALSPVSGAHLNPLVTMVAALRGRLKGRVVGVYAAAQTCGAIVGVIVAHAMFSVPLLQLAGQSRNGSGLLLGEFIASAGLLLVIVLTEKTRPSALPFAVSLFIGSAYWFTSSTSFANPALTFARALSDTFAGIALGDVPAFVVVQLMGGCLGGALGVWLVQPKSPAEPAISSDNAQP